MGDKVKLTLSLSKNLVRRAKSRVALEGRSLSEVIEELLSLYDEAGYIDELCQKLNLEKRLYTSSEVEAERPRGPKSEEVIREFRDERSERLS